MTSTCADAFVSTTPCRKCCTSRRWPGRHPKTQPPPWTSDKNRALAVGSYVSADIAETDLTGARLRKVRVSDARMRMVDVSGAVLRDVDLSGTSIDDAEIDGLRVNGVEVAPLIEAELTRREPARALRRASDPADLREAWTALEESWARTYARVAKQLALADRSVDDESRQAWRPDHDHADRCLTSRR